MQAAPERAPGVPGGDVARGESPPPRRYLAVAAERHAALARTYIVSVAPETVLPA